MTWLVFIVGAALAAIGGASIYSGAPIIQIERGWAEVIAGSVAVSGGVVTLALGVVVLRLRDLHRTLLGAAPRTAEAIEADAGVAGSTSEAQREADGIIPAPSVDHAASTGSADDLGPSFHEAPGLVGTIHPDTESLGDSPPAAPDEAQAEPPATEAREPADNFVDRQPSAAPMVSPDAPADDVGPPRRLTAPSSDLSDVEREPLRERAPLSRDWLSRPLLRARSRPAPPEPPPLFANPPEPDDAPPVTVSADLGSDFPAPATSPPPVDPGAEPDLGDLPQEPEVAVVGRYQAGASSYTMYSDGAIDVETEGGDVHRFGSMDELKAFIARQERALS
jgi:hypothetical protein